MDRLLELAEIISMKELEISVLEDGLYAKKAELIFTKFAGEKIVIEREICRIEAIISEKRHIISTIKNEVRNLLNQRQIERISSPYARHVERDPNRLETFDDEML